MSGWEFTPTDMSDVPSLAHAVPMPPPTLTEFLLARLAEDEALARDAIGPRETDDAGHWEYVEYAYEGGSPEPRGSLATNRLGYDPGLPWTELVNRFDPARVLAECAAKRRIVERFQQEWDDVPERGEPGDDWKAMAFEEAVQILALPYADHDSYDESWRP